MDTKTNDAIGVYEILFSEEKTLTEIYEAMRDRSYQPRQAWFDYAQRMLRKPRLLFEYWAFRTLSRQERGRQTERVIDLMDSPLAEEQKVFLLAWFFSEIYVVVPTFQ